MRACSHCLLQVKHRQELQQALDKANAEHKESLERAIRAAHEQTGANVLADKKLVCHGSGGSAWPICAVAAADVWPRRAAGRVCCDPRRLTTRRRSCKSRSRRWSSSCRRPRPRMEADLAGAQSAHAWKSTLTVVVRCVRARARACGGCAVHSGGSGATSATTPAFGDAIKGIMNGVYKTLRAEFDDGAAEGGGRGGDTYAFGRAGGRAEPASKRTQRASSCRWREGWGVGMLIAQTSRTTAATS